MRFKVIFALILLAVLTVFCVIYGQSVLELYPKVQIERALTPSPAPVFGNVLMVTPDPNAPTSPPVLKKGTEGEAVLQLQERLQALGYYSGKLDGQYGNGTAQAVTWFQRQHQLDADGIAGAATLTLLYSDNAQQAVATPTPAPTASPTPVPTQKAREPYVREDGLPLVVNRSEKLPDDYLPEDLVRMTDVCDTKIVTIKYSDTLAERKAVDALMVMLKAACQDGITGWQVSSAYRSYAYQQRLFDNQVQSFMKENGLSRSKAISAASKLVADPGTSEHHLGTAFDITVPGVSFKGTTQHSWISRHCWEYGFILRYMEDKETVTGFTAEAWHYRWVGKEHALRMRDEQLCLEEYVGKYGTL